MPGPVQSVFIPVPTAMGQLIAELGATNSPITDFSEGSAGRTLLEAFSIVVSNQSKVADQLQLDSFLETATEEALDAQGSNQQVTRLPAVQAAGVVTITRESPSGALVIPAGWSQLTVPPSVPGTEGVAVLTLEAAEFAEGVTSIAVPAQAVLGGTAGNLSAGTFLTPLVPVNTVNSSTGIKVTTAFTGGVNVETDAAYRKRIPITVQGRVKGTDAAFLAGALGVPGVLSANVLKAGELRGDGSSVPGGSVETYYQGSAALLSQVEKAVEQAATINQKASGFASISLSAPRGLQRVVFEATVFYAPGVNGTLLAGTVSTLAQEFVEAVGVGNTLYMSELIEAIHTIPEVVSIKIPLTKLALFGNTGAADITVAGDSYVHLAAGDCVITTTEL